MEASLRQSSINSANGLRTSASFSFKFGRLNKKMGFYLEGCLTGAGGETRTPNIQIRSLKGWNSKDKQG